MWQEPRYIPSLSMSVSLFPLPPLPLSPDGVVVDVGCITAPSAQHIEKETEKSDVHCIAAASTQHRVLVA
jgi:hypothetical protein